MQICVNSLEGDESFSEGGDTRVTSASLIKLLVLPEYFHQVDSGDLNPQKTIQPSTSDIVGGTGIIQSNPHKIYTYNDLARLMISESDNTAANILINTLGMDHINKRAKELNLSHTDLQRKMMTHHKGKENHISANDTAHILTKIYHGTLASKKSCKRAQEFLKEQTDS